MRLSLERSQAVKFLASASALPRHGPCAYTSLLGYALSETDIIDDQLYKIGTE